MTESSSQNPVSNAARAENAGQGDESAQSMSLLSGVARPEGLPQADEIDPGQIDEGGSRALSQGTILVIAVVLIAAGSLYAMRLTQGEIDPDSQKQQQVEAKMEQILAKLSNPAAMSADDPLRPANMQALFKDTDKIVGMLDTDLTNRQVPAQFVKKNPFELPQVEKEEKAEPKNNYDQQQRQAELRRLRNKLGTLSLQTVMQGGSGPIAVINGDFYKPGQSIEDFKITSINTKTLTVKLTASGETFRLSMNDE